MYSADIKYRAYKGRGCHDYCFAIEVEHPFTGLLDIVKAVHENNPDEFQLVLSSLRKVHHDNMGHDVILYKTERKTHPSFLRGWDVSD
jgi:hypothetical protein